MDIPIYLAYFAKPRHNRPAEDCIADDSVKPVTEFDSTTIVREQHVVDLYLYTDVAQPFPIGTIGPRGHDYIVTRIPEYTRHIEGRAGGAALAKLVSAYQHA